MGSGSSSKEQAGQNPMLCRVMLEVSPLAL